MKYASRGRFLFSLFLSSSVGRVFEKGDIMSNKMYDVLKWIAQILLPAAATLYFALSQIWGLPFGEEIVGTITAFDAFLGALLGISSLSYKRGLKE